MKPANEQDASEQQRPERSDRRRLRSADLTRTTTSVKGCEQSAIAATGDVGQPAAIKAAGPAAGAARISRCASDARHHATAAARAEQRACMAAGGWDHPAGPAGRLGRATAANRTSGPRDARAPNAAGRRQGAAAATGGPAQPGLSTGAACARLAGLTPGAACTRLAGHPALPGYACATTAAAGRASRIWSGASSGSVAG